MARNVDADLVSDGDHEAVDFHAAENPRRLHEDARSMQLLQVTLGHRRAHAVVVAAEQDRARQRPCQAARSGRGHVRRGTGARRSP